MTAPSDIPLTTGQQHGGSLLVLLAHNDDEFFISPLLRQEVAAGNRVQVAYLTHGSVYGADSSQRIAESRSVLTSLGIAADETLFIGEKAHIFDSSLPANAELVYQALIAATSGMHIDRILTLAWEGGHPDHDATNIIGAALARTLQSELLEFPAYNACGLPSGLFRVMAFADTGVDTVIRVISLRDGIAAMRRALVYRSQRRTFLGLSPGAALEYLWHRRQQFRSVPQDRDYSRPPHGGLLLFERRFGINFSQFHAQMRSFLSANLSPVERINPSDAAQVGEKRGYAMRPVGISMDEIRLTAGLLQRIWPRSKHLNVEYLRWLYADNPLGHAIGTNAWDGNTLAGHYVLIPIQAYVHGRNVSAALSLNTAMHPAHQGRGLFTLLAEETYRIAKARGIHHVIGVANNNSTHGFVERLGFTLIGPLDAKIVWGAPTPLATSKPCDWERSWTRDSYAWRIAKPNASYCIARYGGRFECLADTGKFGIQAILRVESDEQFVQLLESCLPHRRQHCLKLWIGRSRRMHLSRAAGWNIPPKLRRSPLNLIYRPLTDDAFVPAAEQLEFSLLDFDAY